MKVNLISQLLCAGALSLCALSLHAQEVDPADSTGLPGDHFSLEGAIELFKKATSPEDFEKLLNAEDNHVNNLDLNEDGEVDYIRVIDHVEGDAHAIVLQAPISEDESQDIAVIEIEKQGDEYAVLQIIGNEDVYGEAVIAEAFEEETSAPKRGGNGPSAFVQPYRIVVNVWLWPSVRYVYRPGYAVWVSPWRWRVYPTWWRPWRPHPWRWHYARVAPFRRHCHVVTTHRVVAAHNVYAPRRTSSTVVHTRTTTVVAKRNNGTTTVGRRTTTTTAGKNNAGGATRQTTTTTKAARKSKDGRVSGKKTTTTRTTRKRGRG
ncbi:MAG: hypothetical protein IPH12_20645 [Saprospirales bacterium]|nr:hypothetical protein [Saprospirales bacterium]MBK8923253.1 hypothetical protein [Saprospirales bacterium]